MQSRTVVDFTSYAEVTGVLLSQYCVRHICVGFEALMARNVCWILFYPPRVILKASLIVGLSLIHI